MICLLVQDLVINKKKPSNFKTKCKFPKQEVMSLLSQDLAKKVGPNLKLHQFSILKEMNMQKKMVSLVWSFELAKSMWQV